MNRVAMCRIWTGFSPDCSEGQVVFEGRDRVRAHIRGFGKWSSHRVVNPNGTVTPWDHGAMGLGEPLGPWAEAKSTRCTHGLGIVIQAQKRGIGLVAAGTRRDGMGWPPRDGMG